jgi:putative sigma-54 modulation protein
MKYKAKVQGHDRDAIKHMPDPDSYETAAAA